MDIAFNVYTKEDILGMEKMILEKLEWYLTVPTAYMFLVRYIKIAEADQEVLHSTDSLFTVLFHGYNYSFGY
jgi:G2/mitotic-specific cyclin-B, other